MAAAWDEYARLPAEGENPALDAFLERKNLSMGSLVRLGARLSDTTVLAFEFDGGIKYRDIVSDLRWSYAGSEWTRMKRVPASKDRDASTAIVAEGETDGARLSDLYGDVDVFVLPAGADPRPHTESYQAQLAEYELVLMAQDPDPAGDNGAKMLGEGLAKTTRWTAPGGSDWSAFVGEPPERPSPADIQVPVSERLLVSARELLELDAPEQASWFEQALLPIGGSMIVHGWAKSYKSFIVLDIAAALTQCQPWCGFEPTEEPVRTAVMQYEIPWPYFQQRIRTLAQNAANPQAFLDNFQAWTPMARPRFKAGDQKTEDAVIRALLDDGIQVFVLDPVRRAAGVADLNSEKDVRPLLSFFERVQDAGITVITVHHDNKAYAKIGGGEALGMTGSGAFAGDFDSILSIAVPRDRSIEDPERNIHFLLRNAPSPAPRSLEMTESGLIVYHDSILQAGDMPGADHIDPTL